MNINIDIISLFFLLFFTAYQLYRHSLQLKRLGTVQVFVVMQYVAVLAILLAQAGLILDLVYINHFEFVLKTSLATIFSIILGLVSLTVIKDQTKKKVRTLWRLPFVGFFAGLYLKAGEVHIICSAFFILSLIVLLKDRHRLRYLLKKLVWLLPSVIGIFYIEVNSLYLTNILLLWIVIFGSSILSLANINDLFRSKELN